VSRSSGWPESPLYIVVGLATSLTFSSVTLAQNPDAVDGITFEHRFSVDRSVAPTFTRPEVAELFSRGLLLRSEALRAAANNGDKPTSEADGRSGPLSRLLLAEPKGPAKVLRDLLNTPVKELVVSKAEAETDPPPAREQPDRPASQSISTIPARSAEPTSERPPPQDEITTPGSSAQITEPLQRPRNAERHDAPHETAPPSINNPMTQSDAVLERPGRPEAAQAQKQQDAQLESASPSASTPPGESAPEQREKAEVAQTPKGEQQTLPRPSKPAFTERPKLGVEAAGQPAAPEQPARGASRPVLKVTPIQRGEQGRKWIADRKSRAQRTKLGERDPERDRLIARGRALWYQHPGRTASGEMFNPDRLTAAHHTLPMRTRVRVVSDLNGRSVTVRINDRIPRKVKAVINLSRRSAKVIGFAAIDRVSLYRSVRGPQAK
jgi:rare lipoprotein A (peptidoglycan hydrolase)